MIGLQISEAKKLFFDSKAVLSATDKATRKRLSRFGAFVRRDARSMIRKVGKKGKPAAAGKPPKSRTGLLKANIFFLYDPHSQSVIIGPIKLNGRARQDAPATEALEYGGKVVRADGTVAFYAQHPYMQPAFDANLAKVDQIYRDAVRA